MYKFEQGKVMGQYRGMVEARTGKTTPNLEGLNQQRHPLTKHPQHKPLGFFENKTQTCTSTLPRMFSEVQNLCQTVKLILLYSYELDIDFSSLRTVIKMGLGGYVYLI